MCSSPWKGSAYNHSWNEQTGGGGISGLGISNGLANDGPSYLYMAKEVKSFPLDLKDA